MTRKFQIYFRRPPTLLLQIEDETTPEDEIERLAEAEVHGVHGAEAQLEWELYEEPSGDAETSGE